MSTSVLVTGAAGGIGRAVLLAAAAHGWNVAALDLDGPGAEAVAAEALAGGAPVAIALACDVTDEDAVAAAMDRAAHDLAGLDAVLANAGVELNALLADLTRETWDRVIGVNLTGVFLTVKHAGRVMRVAGTVGSIVCTSSPSAFVGFAGGGNAAYGASKGGVSAFVRAAALDFAADGIRVNGLVPGATDTPLLLAGLEGADRERRAAEIARDARAQIPLGRLAEPSEIAAAAIWLLGPESTYVTGSSLVCDGGLLAKSANTF